MVLRIWKWKFIFLFLRPCHIDPAHIIPIIPTAAPYSEYILRRALPDVLPVKLTGSDGLGSNTARTRLWEKQKFLPKTKFAYMLPFYNSFPQKHIILKCTSKDNIGLQKDERDRTRLESNLIGWANSALSACSASFLLWTVILTSPKRKFRLTLNLRHFFNLYLATNFWIFYLHACNFWW